MLIVKSADELTALLNKKKNEGAKIGLVPTMGYLHKGHLSLIQEAKNATDICVATIFVNPSQFNDPKDLQLYPRDIDRDIEMLKQVETDILFCPEVTDIYGEAFQTFVDVESLSAVHEGEFRPGHFKGVSTIVNILFNLISPDSAFFGEKDFQQLVVIKTMVRDLKMRVNVVSCPIVREDGGLAMSSRNVRLSDLSRKKACRIFKSLNNINSSFLRGNRNADSLISEAQEELSEADFRIEYLRIVDPQSLKLKSEAEIGDRALAAVWLDNVRLIDNLRMGS